MLGLLGCFICVIYQALDLLQLKIISIDLYTHKVLQAILYYRMKEEYIKKETCMGLLSDAIVVKPTMSEKSTVLDGND